MLRRNVASQVVYLPALKLTADGTAVTSGASLTVAKDGTEAACAGSLAHAAGGVWKYTPTQSETDCAILALILTATAADPVVLNLVTTGADTSAVAFGANTTAPNNAGISNAAADAAAAKTAAESADGKLTSGRTSRLDRLPDVNAGAAGGLSLVGSEMTLDSATLAALFSDTDTAALVDAIIARVEDDLDGSDLSVAAIAVAVRNEILDRLLAGNHDTTGSVGAFLQRLDAAVTSRLASGSYTAPDNAGISNAAASAATAASQATTAANRLGAWTGSGINTVLGAIRAIAAKAAGLTPTDLSDGTTFNNVTDSLEAAAETGGSLTPEQQAQLDLIESKVATLTAGRRPQVVSPVSEGGHITLHRDTDYLVDSDSALEIPVDDVGGALAARLEAATLANLRFGAGRPNQGEEISGTVQAVTYSAGTETTTIVVEIERATLESAIVSDGYTYQIRRIDASDRLVREVIGRLTVEENHVD